MLNKIIEKVSTFFERYTSNISLPFAIANAVMSLSYSLIGGLLIIYPDSVFAQMMLPSEKWAYALGIVLVVYGIFRAWRVYSRYKDDDDDDYEYYDGTKG